MQRRHFLKYTSLSTASLLFSGCQGFNFSRSSSENTPPKDPFPDGAVNFGQLEKTNLIIGYYPVIGAMPLIVAKEKGFFQKYGLNVTLKKIINWSEIETGLKKYRLDVAQTPYAVPISAQFSQNYTPMSILMVLHRHGSSIVLDRQTWDRSIRPVRDYFNFLEFAKDFRQDLRQREQTLTYGIDSLNSNNYYLFRYWLSTIGIRTKQEINWLEINNSQILQNLTNKSINGYCGEAPWDRETITNQQAFCASVSKNIWKGHPGSVLATMIPWLDQYPATARALVASVLEACQYCDQSQTKTYLGEILANQNYLNLDVNLIQKSLSENYLYGGFDEQIRQDLMTDFYVFHHQNTDYFQDKDHANFPWLSHGIWFLTQLIRWQNINLSEYPKNADYKLKKVYAWKIYEEVAQALKIKIPTERIKIEPSEFFVDQRTFDPSDPVKYLKQFPREL